MNTDNLQLDLLRAILKATSEGRYSWEEDENGHFVGKGAIPARIELKYPMLGDETVSGADLAAFTVPGVEMAFFSGTEGMKLTQRILMAGLPKWDQHISGIDKKLESLICRIETESHT